MISRFKNSSHPKYICINLLIDLGFSPEPSKVFAPPSGEKVEFLEGFVSANHSPSQSALQMDLSAILKDQSSLHRFMKFLKEESAINQLQFCLSVGMRLVFTTYCNDKFYQKQESCCQNNALFFLKE